jgi:hypothetical protein
MQIIMKALAAGPAGVLQEGKTYRTPEDLSEEFALALIAGHYAEEVAPSVAMADDVRAEVVETAAAPLELPEQAVKPRARKKP